VTAPYAIERRWATACWRAILAVSLVLAALLLVASAPIRGPIILTLTNRRGVDLGDLTALPLLWAATALVRPSLPALGLHRFEPPPARLHGAAIGSCLVVAGSLVLSGASRHLPRASAIAALALVALVALALATLPWRPGLTGWPVAAFVAGALVDVTTLPTGTLVGPALLAAWLACHRASDEPAPARAAPHGSNHLMAAIVAGCGVLNVLSLTDIAGVDVVMARHGGGPARSITLGLVIVAVAIGGGRQRPSPTRA
jgi:hypothetical protein